MELLSVKSENYYRDTYLATVSIENGELVFLGGIADKRRLNLAKRHSSFCYVKDIGSQASVKLVLHRGDWVRSSDRVPEDRELGRI